MATVRSRQTAPRRARLKSAPGALDATQPPAARPLRLVPRAQIDLQLETALRDGRGAEGAHCIHELWMRGEFAARIEAALSALWSRAAASIPDWLPMRHVEWLPTLYEVAAAFEARRRGRHNLYVVLLDFTDRTRGPYGVYVGMSHYRPSQRFDQHKAGIHAAGSVLKRGIELLSGPTLHLQRIARSEALRIEAALADALRDAGLLVEGGH
jgi:hypothetical protein